MSGWLAVVGLGPGRADLVTPEVTKTVAQATDILGYFPYVDRIPARAGLVKHGSDNREELARATQALQLAATGRRAVIVSSGDPGVFAMASALFEAMEADASFQSLEVRILPGITAMLAAAAAAGAPLGHDFCAINLSDNLKPIEIIEKRVALAVQADFAMAFYNPRSKSRPHQFGRVLDVIRTHAEPDRLVTFARAVSTPEERILTVPLSDATEDMADMRTLVIVGSSQTRRVGKWVYTPRGAGGV